MARVSNRVPTDTSTQKSQNGHSQDENASTASPSSSKGKKQKAATALRPKTAFGRGSGRSAGFYRQFEKRADPEAAREAEREAEKERRRRERWEREMAAEREERAREQEEMRQERRRENHDAAGAARRGPECGGRGGEGGGAQARRGTLRDALADQRRSTWHAYDAAFEEFQARAMRTRTFAVCAIPLPPAGHAPVAPASTHEAWHANVKRATLRWHPDKWAKLEGMLGDEAERETLKQLTQAMFRAVTKHKERGFRHARATAGGA